MAVLDASSCWEVTEERGFLMADMPLDDPVVSAETGARDTLVFLGLDAAKAPVFAVDFSTWEPEFLDPEALGLFLDPTEQRRPQRCCAGRMAADLPGLQKPPLSAHRPSGNHVDNLRVVSSDGAITRLAGRHVFAAGRFC